MLLRTLFRRNLFPVVVFACFLPIAVKAQTVAAARPLIVDRVDEKSLVTLKGNTRPEARAQYDRGPVVASLPMRNLVLVLRRSPEQEAAAAAFAASQSDPQSPNYHQWLTPEQVGERFGAAQSDIDAITRWLQGHGFSVDDLSKNHLTIRFSGTASQVQDAFHTEIHNLDVNGAKHIANMSDPQIPAALAPAVVGIQALHNFYPRPLHRMGGTARLNKQTSGWERISPAPSLSVSAPQAAKGGESHSLSLRPEFGINLGGGSVEEDVTPYDFAMIYNVVPLWNASTPIDGKDQTIAIVGTSNINPADIASFRSAFGLPAYSAPTGSTPGISVIIPPNTTDPGDCSNGASSCIDDLVENSLDVEWSGAIAKNASIILVPSSVGSTTDYSSDPVYISSDYIVQNKIAPIMNVSYGQCELSLGTAGNSGFNTLWQTAAMEGIAVFVATGDSGSPSCDQDQATAVPYGAEFGLSVSGVASTPYNTAVGGTDFNWNSTANSQANYWSTSNNSTTLANALGYIPEVPWNDTCTNPIEVAFFNSSPSLPGNLNAAELCNAIATRQITYSDQNEEDNLLSLVNTVGGGGGVSSCTTSDGQNPTSCSGGYPQPSWQTGVSGIPAKNRAIPDVSFFASNGFLYSAYLICVSAGGNSCTYSDTVEPVAQEVGGTSVVSPIMAAVMALINQKTGVSQGSPNAELYKLASTENYSSCSSETATASGSCIFNDVDMGTNAMPCAAGSPNCKLNSSTDSIGILSATKSVNAPSYNATAGYDLATGLGSANVYNLVTGYAKDVNTAAASAATASPASLSFSNVPSGLTSTQKVTVRNTGNVVISFSSVSLSGANASLFSETNNCTSALPVFATCTVMVTFAPTATGTFSGTLSITGTESGTSQTIALTGTAVPPAPAVSLSPSTIAFPNTALGTTASQAITLTNSGNAPLSVTAVTVGGTNASAFGVSNNCTTVAAGATCTITVTFAPLSLGSLSASISIADNASGSPQSVNLTGTGIEVGSYTLAAASVSVTPGSPGTSAITATGTGGYVGPSTITVNSCVLATSPTGATDPPSCTISNATVTFAAGAATGSGGSVSIGSTAATSSAVKLTKLDTRFNSKPWIGLSVVSAAGLLLFGIPARRRRWKSLLGVLLFIATVGALAGCGGGSGGGGGGGSGNPGTTAGTYTFTVTGTDGAGTKATTTLTVTIS